jgi:pimeloyl-ACP methyl ester carboxylesterase
LTFESWTFDRPDGAALAVWDVTAPQPTPGSESPQKLTAVFLHGWGHSRIDSLTRIKPFLPLCDRLILYDLRGHGDSSGSISTLGHHEDDDLTALLERLDDERVLLVGHSMGAVIAMAAASKMYFASHPLARRILGVIAYAPYCEFHHSLCGRLGVAQYPARPISDLALLILRLRGVRPLSLREDTIAGIRCSLLIIHGVEDEVAPPAHGRRIAGAALDAALHEVAGASHVDAHISDVRNHDALIAQFVMDRKTARS